LKNGRLHVTYGARWEDGRLSGKTLFDALRAAGVEPQDQC
jgi:hypothetical protein